MASAIFTVPFGDGGPELNKEQVFDDGTDGYGYSVIGYVPQADTCMVRVWSSEAVLDAMAEDDNYAFVEDVEDG